LKGLKLLLLKLLVLGVPTKALAPQRAQHTQHTPCKGRKDQEQHWVS
jgi:hypothetical protein